MFLFFAFWYSSGYASASNGISLRYDGSGGNSNIDIVTGTDQSGYVGYVVMEYTKNSD